MHRLSSFITLHLLLTSACCLLFHSCAQMQVPGGGPRDVSAPKVINYSPDSAKVNFTGNEVKIVFDENIVLKDMQGQLMVSPPMELLPEITLQKNRILHIKFRETLKANTTYGIYFGNAIADVHEGNTAEGFRYVFSTGPVMDSVAVFGSVTDAFTGAQLKQVTVMLYAGQDDSLPFKKPPEYFSRSGPDGSFRVDHIKPGWYKAVAVLDANRNFRYDPEEELIGFADSLIDLTTSRKLNFRLFKGPPQKQFIRRSVVVEPGKVMIVLNKPCPDLKIHLRRTNRLQTRMWKNERADTILFHYGKFTADTLDLLLVSDADVWKESLALRIADSKAPQLRASVLFTGGELQDPDKPVRILFNHPVDSFSFTGITGGTDELSPMDSSALEFTMQDYIVEVRPVSSKGVILWDPGTEHTVILNPGCFTGFGNLPSDSIKIIFQVKELRYYGSLEVKAQWKPQEGIVQLLNEKGQVVHSDQGSGDLKLFCRYLLPGKYRIRLIYDHNKNGQWDSGDYSRKVQPERVIYSPGWFTVRSDWEVQEVWKVE
ncbi:MAG: Ig-like domain-containing protein [Bacteroidia bacterium]|nr:Ig-like domain-containing protein [Bacteroidia bacterium]